MDASSISLISSFNKLYNKRIPWRVYSNCVSEIDLLHFSRNSGLSGFVGGGSGSGGAVLLLLC